MCKACHKWLCENKEKNVSLIKTLVVKVVEYIISMNDLRSLKGISRN